MNFVLIMIKKPPSNYTIYVDMNNLYGDAMSECLPYGRFKWLRLIMK